MSRKKEMKLMWDAIRLLQKTAESHNRTLADIVQSLKELSDLVLADHSVTSLNPN